MHLTRLWRAAATMLLGALALSSQQPPPTPANVPATVLRVTTRLVLVDVVVTDKQGNPVTDLTRDDFTLMENGKAQRIATFSLENPGGAQHAAVAPVPLPPNVVTNKPEYRLPPGPLSVLLLDALNTPMQDQSYAREQMLRYLRTQLQPNQRTAILALTDELLLLQDFTADPATLIAALQEYGPRRTARQGESGPVINPDVIAQIADLSPQVVSNLERFEEEYKAFNTDQRVAVTLEALQTISRALAGYPGRKILVWVSATFPFSLSPDDQSNLLSVYRNYSEEIRRTASVLSDAQVAVYPVDARGLVGYPMANAAESLRNTSGRSFRGPEFGDQLTQRTGSLRDTHATMQIMAEATGGRAFYNRNDIDAAVALSAGDGSTYYTLGYYPESKEWDGKFRNLEVKVARKGIDLRYRRGYYATDPAERTHLPKDKEPASADEARDAALKFALRTRLPMTLVTFRAGVIPPAPAPAANVEVRFLVDPPTVLFEPDTADRRHASLDFLVAALSPEGKLVKAANDTLEADLTPENYVLVQQQGVRYRMAIELPPGRYILRLVVRDNRTGLMGSADAPLVLESPDKT